MRELTHQTARTLLQTAADRALAPADQATLANHLAGCPTCRAYASQLNRLESDLRRLTRQQWARQKPALDLAAIQRGLQSATGFAFNRQLAFAMLLATLFVAASLFGNFPGRLTFSGAPLPIPGLSSATPTVQTATATRLPTLTQTCQELLYTVQPGETLDTIAARFGLTKQALLSLNALGPDPLTPGQQLTIPLCAPIPEGTATPTHTSTPLSQLPAAPHGFETCQKSDIAV